MVELIWTLGGGVRPTAEQPVTLKRVQLHSSKPQDPTTGPRNKTLYVEDEDINWDIAAKRLGPKYDMQRACNAAEAFSKLRSDTFSIILMDIQLHNSTMSGIEITRILRGKITSSAMQAITTPIIFVTAYSARYSRQDLLNEGGDDLIIKPVDFFQLTSAITRLILRQIK